MTRLLRLSDCKCMGCGLRLATGSLRDIVQAAEKHSAAPAQIHQEWIQNFNHHAFAA